MVGSMTVFSQHPKTPLALSRAKESYLLQRRSLSGRYILRSAAIAIPAAGVKQRSKTVVLATEQPVQRWDDSRYTVVSEVLLLSGIQFRNDRKALPLVDSGDVSSVRNIIGSVRNIRIDRGQLLGDVVFARDAKAQAVAQKFQDGHLNDFSVISSPIELLEVQSGQKWKHVDGPANIVTRWVPLSASIGFRETEAV